MTIEVLFSGVLGAAILYLIQLLISEKRLQTYWAKWNVKRGRTNDNFWFHFVNMNNRVVTVSNVEIYAPNGSQIKEGFCLQCSNDGKTIGINDVIYIYPFHIFPLKIEIIDKALAGSYGYDTSIGEIRFLSNASGNFIMKFIRFLRARASGKRCPTSLLSYKCAGV